MIDVTNYYIHNIVTDNYAKITQFSSDGVLHISPVFYNKVSVSSHGTTITSDITEPPVDGNILMADTHSYFITWGVQVGDVVGFYDSSGNYTYNRIVQVLTENTLLYSGALIPKDTKYTIYRAFARQGEAFKIMSAKMNTGYDKDIVVRIKKVYYTDFNTPDNRYVVLISDQKLSQLRVMDCFLNPDGTEKDYIYLGVYKGCIRNNIANSMDNVLPTTGLPRATLRSATNTWSVKELNNLFIKAFVDIMMVIEFKRRDPQNADVFLNKLPIGIIPANLIAYNNGVLKPILPTGLTNKLGNKSGTVNFIDTRNGITINTYQSSYRGIEG